MKSLDKAQTRVDKFKGAASKALKGFAVAGGAAIAGFAVKAIGDFVELGDELDKMSQRGQVSRGKPGRAQIRS